MNVIEITDRKYRVDSETTPGLTYYVTKRRDGSWYCECKSYKHHTDECKHILEVEDYRQPSEWEVFNGAEGWTNAMASLTDWGNNLHMGTHLGYEYWMAWDYPAYPLRYRRQATE